MSTLVILIAVMAVSFSPPLQAAAQVSLSADLSGTINGTEFKIRVPSDWNGTLLVYVHGYGTTAIETVPPTYPPASPSLETHLLREGYALASSFYPTSEKEGLAQTYAVTQLFRSQIGNPRRTILWGSSFGGLLVAKLAETYPNDYDAVFSCCGVIAGNPKFMDSSLRMLLAYKAAFGWNDDKWGPIGDLRDDLLFRRDVFPFANIPTPTTMAATFGRWEFVRLIMKMSPEAFWQVKPADAVPGFVTQLFFATEFRARLERENGGPVAQNLSSTYTLTKAEKDYLATKGVNADQLLAAMNAHPKITADPAARASLERYGEVTGNLRIPMLTMRGEFDGTAIIFHDSAYRSAVETSMRTDLLQQVYVNDLGHCYFTKQQYLMGLTALERWLDTGVKPDLTNFPAGLGFDRTFVPPPWPF